MCGGERRGIQPSAVRVPTGLGEVIDDLKNTAPPPAFCLFPCASMFLRAEHLPLSVSFSKRNSKREAKS